MYNLPFTQYMSGELAMPATLPNDSHVSFLKNNYCALHVGDVGIILAEVGGVNILLKRDDDLQFSIRVS